MASTNKTTHYELSQYVGTDKPTYLTDYNQDMSRIDAGIYGAKSLADVNETAIGDLTNLTTTAKNNLVSAINELDGEVATNTGNISTNTTNIDANTTAIGTLSNLTTSAKNNLVSAINEVDANSDSNTSAIATNTSAIGTLSNLTTTEKSNLVGAVNEVDSLINKLNLTTFKSIPASDITTNLTSPSLTANLTLASNSDYSVIKFYGSINFTTVSRYGHIYIANCFPAGYRPTEDITIAPCGYLVSNNITNYQPDSYSVLNGFTVTLKTDGSIDIVFDKGTGNNCVVAIALIPFIIFVKNFGDTPIQN